jgi:hypothetical protein
MIFFVALLLWFLIAVVLHRAAEWFPIVFLICFHTLLFIASLKITETLFLR